MSMCVFYLHSYRRGKSLVGFFGTCCIFLFRSSYKFVERVTGGGGDRRAQGVQGRGGGRAGGGGGTVPGGAGDAYHTLISKYVRGGWKKNFVVCVWTSI